MNTGNLPEKVAELQCRLSIAAYLYMSKINYLQQGGDEKIPDNLKLENRCFACTETTFDGQTYVSHFVLADTLTFEDVSYIVVVSIVEENEDSSVQLQGKGLDVKLTYASTSLNVIQHKYRQLFYIIPLPTDAVGYCLSLIDRNWAVVAQ